MLDETLTTLLFIPHERFRYVRYFFESNSLAISHCIRTMDNHILVYSPKRVLAEELHVRGKVGCHSSNRSGHAGDGKFARSTLDP